MRRTTRFVGVAGSLLGAFVAYTLFPDPLLAATAGLCWGVGGALTTRHRAVWTGDPERTSLLDGAPAALVLVVGLFGVHRGLPVPSSLRWALVFLVVGAALSGIGLGLALGGASPADGDSTETGTD
ncbi:hypothetical protein [Halogeometricum limi]|uniref:Uncharacterized protein n=1 Tax=Halogeometricum limi TaxID=555875 RepID=A0A1I6FQC2_9EURY|nr:hypothetical protein [Halogeometricum limi]SFR32143.1 hypothetical protein SAMN04488124_0069 [Halogeometricum limi]